MRARCLQHPSTGQEVGQGLFAELLGHGKRQIFVSVKNAEMLPEPLSPSGKSGALASFHCRAKAQPGEVEGLNPAALVGQAQSWEENATSKENEIAPESTSKHKI